MFICAFFAVGCSGGGGGDSFVASPGGGVPAGGGAATGTGSVTFNFVRAQSPIVVPTSTVQLRFEFFTGLQGTGTILKRELRNYADTVTIENVPNTVRSTVVTALTAEGFPIANFTANVTVQVGGNVVIDAGDGTLQPITAVSISSSPSSVALGTADSFQLNVQVTFSNGEVVEVDPSDGVVDFVSTNPAVATVDGNGLITAGLNGTAFVTATLNAPGFGPVAVDIPVGVGDGVQPPPTIKSIAIITPATDQTLAQGTMSVPLVVQATFSNDTTAVVTAAEGLTFESNRPDDVSVDGSQQIVVANDAEIGQTATITARFGTLNNSIDVTVVDATLASISASPAVIDLPYGGFQQVVVVTGTFTNGSSMTINPANLNFAGPMTRYGLDTSNNTITVTTLAAMSPPAPGTEVLTISHATEPVPDTTVNVTVGETVVDSLTPDPSPLTGENALVPGERTLFTVTATLDDGRQIDVSLFSDLQVAAVQDDSGTPGQDNIAVSVDPTDGAQVVAIAPTGAPPDDFAQVTFTLLGAGTGGNDVTSPVNVQVIAEVIDFDAGLRYEFAGNDIANFSTGAGGLNAVNLPRGYVGVIEVYATFTSGVERKLRPGEYRILLGDSTTDPGFIGQEFITLWQTDDGDASDPPATDFYVHTPTSAQFTTDDANVAPFDALYYVPRTVDNAFDAGQEGSTTSTTLPGTGGVAVHRRTFRAVVADWRRGALEDGALDNGSGNPVANPDAVAPGGVRRVIVRLEPSVLAASENPPDRDFAFTVTIVDPPSVSITSAGFVGNNAGDNRTPVGTVREYEVRADFEPPTVNTDDSPDGVDLGTVGPTLLDPITNFKLAEANIDLLSNTGGAAVFAQSAPTDVGYIGIYSNTQSVANNAINVRAIPVGGDNVRPVISDDNDTPADFTDDSYLYVFNVYGVTSGNFEMFESPAAIKETDPADAESDPDDFARRVYEIEPAIQFQIPFLFSLDPPTNDPSDTETLEVGQSQRFRTVVQWNSTEAPIDVSEDYPPVLFTDVTTPGATSRLANVASDPGSALGNIIVSAIVAVAGTVDESDVAAQSGDVFLGDAITDLNGGDSSYSPTEALIVALDAAGFPIPSRGTFGAAPSPPNVNDLRDEPSTGSAVSGIETIAPPTP